MLRYVIVLSLAMATHAFLFGGGGGGCCCQQQSSCCAPPPAPVCAPPPPPPPCQCEAPAPCQPQTYVQPVAAPCRPRYIIVRPVEVAPQSYPAPPPVGYAQPVPSYQPAPSSYASQPTAPVVQAPAPEIAPEPIAPAPIENAQQAGYRALASKTQLLDPKCNSLELRAILAREITVNDVNESKRRVHKTANEQFQTPDSDRGIDVICAEGTFSYRIATDIFCEYTKENITCFAYQQNL